MQFNPVIPVEAHCRRRRFSERVESETREEGGEKEQ
jgi:hypothetical protein